MSVVRYIMALIMTIKVFQFRHPDLTANAYKVLFASCTFCLGFNMTFQVFMLVALIMLLEVLGIFYGNTLFWVVALSAYFIGIILVRRNL